MDATRIADLRRRLQADPTSIAFAQLAEEYRRAGQFDEAVSVCRDGLQRHPGYLSARVTLGRALAELGRAAEAEQEFEHVLRAAPDNLAAIRGLAEIHQKQGHLERALVFYRRALSLARYDPELDDTVQAIARELGTEPPEATSGLSFEQAERELLDAPARVPAVPGAARVDFDALLRSLGYEPDAPAPPIVEAWLSDTPVSPLTGDRSGGSEDPPRPAEFRSSTTASGTHSEIGRGGSPDPPLMGPSAEPGADLLANLEAELRQLEQRPPTTLPSQSVPMTAADIDRVVIAELERWLAAIAVRRRTLAGRV